jgi:hypothetical protein
MRHLYVVVFGALLAQSSFAQSALTGHWLAEQVGPDGEKRQTVFNFFTPKNGAFTGYMSGMQAISWPWWTERSTATRSPSP